MGRTRYNIFARSTARHYVIVWDLQWRIIECQCVEGGSELRAALDGTIERLERDGWRSESAAEFGFAFVTRAAERRLVMITPRDPYNSTVQSFSPFGPAR